MDEAKHLLEKKGNKGWILPTDEVLSDTISDHEYIAQGYFEKHNPATHKERYWASHLAWKEGWVWFSSEEAGIVYLEIPTCVDDIADRARRVLAILGCDRAIVAIHTLQASVESANCGRPIRFTIDSIGNVRWLQSNVVV